jgi:hypothetical protein
MMEKTINYFKQECYLAYDKYSNTRLVECVLKLPLYRYAFIRLEYEPPPVSKSQYTDPTFTVYSSSIISSDQF